MNTDERFEQQLDWFKARMAEKLHENNAKGGWDQLTFPRLFQFLLDELNELHWELIRLEMIEVQEIAEEIIRECADVANFAMMIADNANRTLHTTKS